MRTTRQSSKWRFTTTSEGKKQKKKIIARWRGYHGVTVAAGSLTGLPGMRRFFDLPLPTVGHVDWPDRYHVPERSAADYARDLEKAILAEGPETVRGFHCRTGEGHRRRTVPAGRDIFARFAKFSIAMMSCSYSMRSFVDLWSELGSAPTGLGVTPDMMTTAKGLTSGYLPMTAVLIGRPIWSAIEELSNS